MKALERICSLLLIVLLISSCSRDYDAPPVDGPVYTGDPANITVAGLKALYPNVATTELIDVAYILKVYVSGNDISGNIYKQLYLQDETGAINIGVDQNEIKTYYRVGQEVFLQLHGLSMVKYGGELQIGSATANANRVSWEEFSNKYGLANGNPNASKVVPTVRTIKELTPDMVNTLVTFESIYFVNGGKNAFTSNDQTTDEAIKDGAGNTLNVRTSSYSTFAKNMLPEGGGSITGILGRYNGAWQLIIRDEGDIGTFGGELPGEPTPDPGEDILKLETMGDGTYTSAESRLKIDLFDDWKNKAPIVYSDPYSGKWADVRSTSSTTAHVWFPAHTSDLAKEAGLRIEGLESGHTNMKLEYEIAMGTTGTGDASHIVVKCNGTNNATQASGTLTTTAFISFTLDIPDNTTTIEFYSGATNTVGYRIDNIRVYTSNAIVVP